ncbi:regakine-1-like [Silurus meridionalis]|uniref:C-C motif chemokine n=1 Tax=Silurus meridionalis TaxID=175797 RepID=A0A8T0BIC3_SILME|nr:regakine-1-like [Silurus meridionalis]KAF7706808.1 hypothetical protein HF521_020062 [Silurus meridionalis]KAI5101584.1 C-C motif chemokine 3-like [Silurus meridionalis]
MISRPVLILLLVFGCLQYYAMGNTAKGPEDCCFKFFLKPIPVRAIQKYENTSNDCPKSGVIFTTQNSSRICADPGFKWVQRAIDLVDQRMYDN